MLKTILITAAVVIVGFVILVATRPADFRVTRTAAVSAPPSVVFAQVNELRKWEAWSPWGKLDPAMKQTYEGPPAGTGAAYGWSGNKNVGEGRMTITECRPNEFIRFNLEFVKPFAGICTTEFTFQPQGDQTAVTWTMSGKNNFMAKAMGLFMNCDKMVGGQFDQGLAAMKSVAETAAKNNEATVSIAGKP
ncbi:MAG: SRPBCC family protein [Verrucomicrobia bacterium]|nr:SRPBCC family protein [Verrucomicrobiota bacterium]